MENISLKTHWQTVLNGIRYETYEFIDDLPKNVIAQHVWINDDLNEIAFWDEFLNCHRMYIEGISNIEHYIVEEVKYNNHYIKVLMVDGRAIEFKLACVGVPNDYLY